MFLFVSLFEVEFPAVRSGPELSMQYVEVNTEFLIFLQPMSQGWACSLVSLYLEFSQFLYVVT